jgi:hypothetical protein
MWLSGPTGLRLNKSTVRYRNEKEISMPESARYGNKVTQSGTGMLRYRTEMMDAGIAMSAGSAL